jgi:hypothetical protein
MIAPLYFNPTLRGGANTGCPCGCGSSCHQAGMGYFGFLGETSTITAEAAMQQAIQENSGLKLNPKQFQDSGWLSQAASHIESASFSTTGEIGRAHV